MPPAQPDPDSNAAVGSEAKWASAAMRFDQGRWELAIRELRDLLAMDPQHAPASALLARALAARGDHDAALHQARETIALAPDSAYSHDALAQVWMHR